MGRVEDALERAARARKGADVTTFPDPVAAGARHESDMRVVPPRYLDRFPMEAGGPPPAPEPVRASAEEGSNGKSNSEVQPYRGRQAMPASEPAAPPSAFAATLAEKLVVMQETSSVAIEQYRKLAATLHQLQLERRSKVIMIASAVAGEGKTLTALNLALTLSESFQHRVLLVDADLRQPQIHELCQIPALTGLTEGLKSTQDLRVPVFRVSSRLLLLPAGRPEPDPMQMLTSDRMRRVIKEASSSFDWVILDSPPVANLPDAHLLAGLIDLAVVVVAAGRTPYTAVARAVETLGRERVAGIVLNQVEDSALDATRQLAFSTLQAGAGSSAHDDD